MKSSKGTTVPTLISPASPWQNGVAERWIGSCRRELLDNLVVLNDVHLRCLIRGNLLLSRGQNPRLSGERHTGDAACSCKPDPSARSFPSSASVACIIDMIGSRRPEWHL